MEGNEKIGGSGQNGCMEMRLWSEYRYIIWAIRMRSHEDWILDLNIWARRWLGHDSTLDSLVWRPLVLDTTELDKTVQIFPAFQSCLGCLFSGKLEWGELLDWVNYHCICKYFSLCFVLLANLLTNSLITKPTFVLW